MSNKPTGTRPGSPDRRPLGSSGAPSKMDMDKDMQTNIGPEMGARTGSETGSATGPGIGSDMGSDLGPGAGPEARSERGSNFGPAADAGGPESAWSPAQSAGRQGAAPGERSAVIRRLDTMVQSHPVASVGVATAIGMLVGAATRGRAGRSMALLGAVMSAAGAAALRLTGTVAVTRAAEWIASRRGSEAGASGETPGPRSEGVAGQHAGV